MNINAIKDKYMDEFEISVIFGKLNSSITTQIVKEIMTKNNSIIK